MTNLNIFLIKMEEGEIKDSPLSQQNSLICKGNPTAPTRNPYVVTTKEFLLRFFESNQGLSPRGLPLWCNVLFMSHFYLRVSTYVYRSF